MLTAQPRRPVQHNEADLYLRVQLSLTPTHLGVCSWHTGRVLMHACHAAHSTTALAPSGFALLSLLPLSHR